MESGVAFYTLEGEAVDVETIIKLRSWMEDEVAGQHGVFEYTKLRVMDYDARRNSLGFCLDFFK